MKMKYDAQLEKLTDKGWKEMRQILDLHLPVQRRSRKPKFFQEAHVIATILIVLLFSVPHLNKNTHHKTHPNQNLSARIINAQQPLKTGELFQKKSQQKTTAVYHQNKLPPYKKSTDQISDSSTTPLSALVKSRIVVNNLVFEGDQPDSKSAPALLTPHRSDIALPEVEMNRGRTDKFEVNAGIAYNFSYGRSFISPQVYGMFPLTNNMKLGLGLSVDVQRTDILTSKSLEYINNQALNIQYRVNTQIVKRLTYLTIPLEIRNEIIPNFQLIAGLQASILGNKVLREKEMDYDFQSTPQLFSMPLLQWAAPGQTLREDGNVPLVDIRFRAGMAYHFKKFGLNVTYQEGMQKNIRSFLPDGSVSHKKSKTVSIGFEYNIH